MKKILVPCDFSEPAIAAFQFALDIALLNNSKITVLTVIDVPIVIYGASVDMPAYDFNPNLYKELEADVRKKYDKMVNKYAKGFSKISHQVTQGSTSSMINDFANKKGIDLVVMGTHGASGLKEFFVGSNAEKVVRFSKAPVFAIRKYVPVSSIKNIVFPTSLHTNQTDFLKKLKTLQEFFNATLHILYVNTPVKFVRDNELKEYSKHFKFSNYTLNIRNDRYEPDGIIAFANEIKADMLAMATHGRRGLAHFISGSVAEDVVNHVKCPVWTYTLRNKK